LKYASVEKQSIILDLQLNNLLHPGHPLDVSEAFYSPTAPNQAQSSSFERFTLLQNYSTKRRLCQQKSVAG